MPTWEVNTAATSASGLATETMEHGWRCAYVNLTDLGDGTSVVSLSLRIRGTGAKRLAELLLRERAPLAVLDPEKEPRDA